MEIGGEVDSAGFRGGNKPITKKMRGVLENLGIKKKLIESHRSKEVTVDLIRRSTVIFCMTPNHSRKLYSKYRSECKSLSQKIVVLPLFIGQMRIADPMFSSDIKSYISCVENIQNSILFIKNRLESNGIRRKIDIREWL